MFTIEFIEDNTGELARQAKEESAQYVALKVGDELEKAQAENKRLREANEPARRVVADLMQHIAELEAENKRLRAALEEIRDGRKPQVCSLFEICTHEGCNASYAAFAIADAALSPDAPQEPESEEKK